MNYNSNSENNNQHKQHTHTHTQANGAVNEPNLNTYLRTHTAYCNDTPHI